jgi:ABC-type siderophore export system fused ATPase/permease subunit
VTLRRAYGWSIEWIEYGNLTLEQVTSTHLLPLEQVTSAHLLPLEQVTSAHLLPLEQVTSAHLLPLEQITSAHFLPEFSINLLSCSFTATMLHILLILKE